MLVCCWMSRALTGDWPSPAPPPPLPLPRPHQPHAEADDAWGQPPVKAVPHRPRRGTATYLGGGGEKGWLGGSGRVPFACRCHATTVNCTVSRQKTRHEIQVRTDVRTEKSSQTLWKPASVGPPAIHPSRHPGLDRVGEGRGGGLSWKAGKLGRKTGTGHAPRNTDRIEEGVPSGQAHAQA